jgi:hypothetical protein
MTASKRRSGVMVKQVESTFKSFRGNCAVRWNTSRQLANQALKFLQSTNELSVRERQFPNRSKKGDLLNPEADRSAALVGGEGRRENLQRRSVLTGPAKPTRCKTVT